MIFIKSERAYATSYILVINSNLGSMSHRFRDTATCSLKLSIENCCQTAADGYYWHPIGSRQRPILWYRRRLPTTYRLATIHPWLTTNGQTDDNHIKSSTVTKCGQLKKQIQAAGYRLMEKEHW